MKTAGNTILITGGTSGIGLALTKRFYDLNNSIIVLAKNPEKLKQLKHELSKIQTIQCDLISPKSLRNAMEEIERIKSINIFINNAGVQYNYNLGELDPDTRISDEITINFTSLVELCNFAISYFRKNKVVDSAIVNVSSGLGLVPKQAAPVYCGTKAATHIFTKSIRWQLESGGVKVFEIMPALVDTSMTAGRGNNIKITPDQLVDEFIKNFERDKLESKIGKVKLLDFVNRFVPRLAESIMRKGL